MPMRKSENYKSQSPMKNLERFNYIAPTFAFKADSTELNANALASYMQFQNNKKNVSVCIPRNILRQPVAGSQYTNQQVGTGTQIMKSHTPNINRATNLKVAQIITGPTDLSYLNLQSNNLQADSGRNTDMISGNMAKQAINNTKNNKFNDFSPFENFLMNLLQKEQPYQVVNEQQVPKNQTGQQNIGMGALASAGNKMALDQTQQTGRPVIRVVKKPII